MKWIVFVTLAFSAGLAACLREPDEAALPYDVIDTEPAPEPWLNVPIAEGEAGCELRQVERMLNANCGECHSGPDFMVPSDCMGACAFTPVRIAELIEIGKVTPGDAEASRLLIRVNRGEMPPPSSGLPLLPEADVAWLASFIDSLEPGIEPTCSPAR